jgi:alkylated DNA nucleotide flippase Atl1
VLNAKGEISERTGGDSHELQRMLLEAEGVILDARGRVDLTKCRWKKR